MFGWKTWKVNISSGNNWKVCGSFSHLKSDSAFHSVGEVNQNKLYAYFTSRNWNSGHLLSGKKLMVMIKKWNLDFVSSLLNLQMYTQVYTYLTLVLFDLLLGLHYRAIQNFKFLSIVFQCGTCETTQNSKMIWQLYLLYFPGNKWDITVETHEQHRAFFFTLSLELFTFKESFL